jgi:hypothetical protein
VALLFAGVADEITLVVLPTSVAPTEVTELGILLKRKFIVILGVIVFFHMLLLYALFDMTTEFVAELILVPLVNVDKLDGLITA